MNKALSSLLLVAIVAISVVAPLELANFKALAQSIPSTSAGIGPINLTYKKGGLWLTEQEIMQIPMDNASWKSLTSYASKPMNIINDIECTAGGACSSDSTTPQAMYARAIVGIRTGNQNMISQLKSEIDKVEAAINNTIDVKKNLDDKWVERNIALINVAANIIDYRPSSLLTGLRKALQNTKFSEGTTVQYVALNQLPNRPAYGRWSLFTAAYLWEDWSLLNTIVKAHAKALGEKNWGGVVNDYKFKLTGTGNKDNWQTLQPGGKLDPIAIMPAGTMYQGHGVGGLWLADQYRAANGPQWAPSYTDYIWEGMASYVAISFAADHLGYKNVFELGNYALLRAQLFAYSNHDGKKAWSATGNDVWQVAAIATWVKTKLNNNVAENLKPEPGSVTAPLPVNAGGSPGRGMGFMYATHYARLAK